MVHTVRLAASSTDFYVVGKACLVWYQYGTKDTKVSLATYSHCCVQSSGNLIILL